MSGISRRALLGGLALAPGLVRAEAGAYPDRPLRLVVPYPPGGSTDIVGRLVARALFESLGKPVVVDNRGGAAGAIGAAKVARAAPDGHTLLVHIVTTAVLTPLMQPGLPYDPITAFQPVALVAKLPNVLVVSRDLPVRTLAEFGAWIRANPARANYGTGGEGSVMHLTGEVLKRQLGLEMTHVPYRGAAPAIQDLMAGNIAAVLDNITGVMGPIRGGMLRALGVTTERRSAALPDVPTLAEAGSPGFANSSWLGIYTRAGVSPEVLARLEAAVLAVAARPDAVAALTDLGAEPAPLSTAALDRFWKDEFAYWRRAISAAGLTPG